MVESATLRETRRTATARRITLCAQQLTDERGFEGFTMDDLAEAAELSRRTLFNYYPSKGDAVLGSHDADPVALATFRAKGPHGVLTDDVCALVTTMLEDKAIARDEAARLRRIFRESPRLLAAAHDSMNRSADLFVTEILQREGDAVDVTEARLLVRVMLSIFDLALDDFIVSADDQPLSEIYAELFSKLRRTFA
jgi:AcrR family transcriptional regulator